MKIETNKYGLVSIRWEYDKGENPVKTKAFLERKVEGSKDKEIIKEVVVKRRYADKHDKQLARKYSLEKLVQQSFSRHTELEDRVKVWDAFKNRSLSSQKDVATMA